MVLLFLACSGPPETVVVPTPPKVAPRPPAPPPLPVKGGVGHCDTGETVRFSCSVRGGKTATVCEGTTGWSYRFGKVGAPELTLPDAAVHLPPERSEKRVGEDAALYEVSFRSETHRYTVEVSRTEDQFEGLIRVQKGVETIATLPCNGEVEGDFTEWGDPESHP